MTELAGMMPTPYPNDPVVAEAEAVPQAVDEINQQPITPLALVVKHDGPIQTQELPARHGAHGTEILPAPGATGGAQPVMITGRNPKRKRIVLISIDKPFIVSASAGGVQKTAGGTVWPANVPLVIGHKEQLYALCFSVTPADVATVGWYEEDWAD